MKLAYQKFPNLSHLFLTWRKRIIYITTYVWDTQFITNSNDFMNVFIQNSGILDFNSSSICFSTSFVWVGTRLLSMLHMHHNKSIIHNNTVLRMLDIAYTLLFSGQHHHICWKYLWKYGHEFLHLFDVLWLFPEATPASKILLITYDHFDIIMSCKQRPHNYSTVYNWNFQMGKWLNLKTSFTK